LQSVAHGGNEFPSEFPNPPGKFLLGDKLSLSDHLLSSEGKMALQLLVYLSTTTAHRSEETENGSHPVVYLHVRNPEEDKQSLDSRPNIAPRRQIRSVGLQIGHGGQRDRPLR
jgi:hypothetical protein